MTAKRSSSRSDEVRQRRSREQTKRQRQTVERAYRPQPMAVARERRLSATPRKKPKGRRFNIALGLPRSQLQSSSLPRLRPGWRAASLTLSLALGILLYLLWSLPYFRVTQAEVTGAARLAPAEINAALGLNGRPIFSLRPLELAAQLRRAYPELSSAQVTIGLPNRVQVEVVERQPLLLWQHGNGYTWIDASGVAFRPRGEASGLIPIMSLETPPAGQPTADDPLSPPPYLSPEMVKSAQILAASLPAGVTMIYDPVNGFGWNDPQGWQVFFGSSLKDMALKARVYQALVASLTARGITPAFISVVHVDAPYYRMAQ
jgi:hypothetical protein